LYHILYSRNARAGSNPVTTIPALPYLKGSMFARVYQGIFSCIRLKLRYYGLRISIVLFMSRLMPPPQAHHSFSPLSLLCTEGMHWKLHQSNAALFSIAASATFAPCRSRLALVNLESALSLPERWNWLVIKALAYCLEGRIEFDVELRRGETCRERQDQGDGPCMLRGLFRVYSHSGPLTTCQVSCLPPWHYVGRASM
jgi:hypothetical protein